MAALLFVDSGCVSPPIPPASSANPDRGLDLLIAYEPTVFKQLLVLKIAALAEQRKWETRIVDIRDLPAESLKSYRAAIVLSSVWAGRHRAPVRKFLAGLDEEQRSRTILINTAVRESWKTKERGVHAVTCASRPGRIDALIALVGRQLDLILSPKEE
ncbi:MAG: hypothetical protein ACUVWX_03650 [Kiritimatiellia bacterium]